MFHAPRWLLLAICVLASCKDGSDKAASGDDTGDADRDGFPAYADCDDGDPSIYPGANEVCDGIDNDCDGAVDDDADDAAEWYVDDDDDGWGRDVGATSACDQPAGYVGTSGDCNDANADIHPEATEVCDGADDDCDGITDPDDSADASTWYADTDGDEYGDPDSSSISCEAGSEQVGVAGDCDDTDAAIHPEASEICDGLDNDCDGSIDPDDSADATIWYADIDADGYGDPAESWTSCVGDGSGALSADDCDDTDADVHPDAPEVCDDADLDEDCDGLRDDDDGDVTGTTAWYPDDDDDGYGSADGAAVSACDKPAGYTDNAEDCDDGDAAVSPVGWPCTVDLDSSAAKATFTGVSPSDFAGYSLWTGDDYNLDGNIDYEIGAYYRGSGKGTVYVVFGPVSGTKALSGADLSLSDSSLTFVGYALGQTGDLDGDGERDLGLLASKGGFYGFYAPVSKTETLSAPDVRLTAEVSEDYLTQMKGALDLNGDGQDDLLVADGNWPSLTRYAGAVYASFGPLSGTAALSDADLILRGEADGDQAGGRDGLAQGGDIDGDGVDDLLVGATYNDDAASYAGAAYVVLGGETGTLSLADAEAIITGTGANQYLGSAVAGGGDVDGDGYDDMLIGSSRYGTSYQGGAWLLSGPLSGDYTLADATASLLGTTSYDYVGETFGQITDLDADGQGDLVIGALLDYTCGAAAETGSVYVYFGDVSGALSCAYADAIIAGSVTNGRLSRGLVTPGDLDGDGLGDLLVGAYYEGAGKAYLYSGADL